MITIKTCPCGKKIKVKHWLVKRKKFCSKVCFYRYRKRPSGLKYKLKVINPTWFKRGESVFKGKHHSIKSKELLSLINKGKHFSPNTEFKKGQKSWNKDKEFFQIQDEKHPNWKGDGVGYNALHTWMYRTWEKSKKCDFCGLEKKIDWANKNGIYNRNRINWLNLCRKCHLIYDKRNPKRKPA